MISFIGINEELLYLNIELLEQQKTTSRTPPDEISFFKQKGFTNVILIENKYKFASNLERINKLANYEMIQFGLTTIEQTPIFKVFEIKLLKEKFVVGCNSCSYACVRSCAITRIHSLGWFDMTMCVLEGIGCVYSNYASCAVDICFPTRTPTRMINTVPTKTPIKTPILEYPTKTPIIKYPH